MLKIKFMTESKQFNTFNLNLMTKYEILKQNAIIVVLIKYHWIINWIRAGGIHQG